MTNRFAEMDCCVLAGGKSNPISDFLADGELTRLEKGYRQYAAVFENVKLVLKREQATGRYLNYPHICDEEPDQGMVFGIKAALKQAGSDAVFIGSSEIVDFPLELIVELVKQYNGEFYLGYNDSAHPHGNHQPLFGIYNRKFMNLLEQAGFNPKNLAELLKKTGRLIPLPSGTAVAGVTS